MKMLILLAIVSVLVVSGCVQQEGNDETPYAKCDSCCPQDITPYAECDSCCPEEKALIDSLVAEWGENYYNSSESIFSVDIYNYGYVEAKNVVIECSIYEEGKQIPTVSNSRNVGNVGSTSIKRMDIYVNNKDLDVEMEGITGACSPTSCSDNCVILNDRIPELQQ
jgi:hypothetical protein